MANAPAHAPIFPRGSTVLEYWLVHAEGLTVQPLGARVEKVVVAAPEGRAESLVIRSGVTRRRTQIPAGAIAAVHPSAGELLLDPSATPQRAHVSVPRPSPDHLVSAARRTQRGTESAVAWARPRVESAADATARGVAWLTPRVVHALRTAGFIAAQLAIAGLILVTRAAAYAGRTASAAFAQGRASLEARRARQRT